MKYILILIYTFNIYAGSGSSGNGLGSKVFSDSDGGVILTIPGDFLKIQDSFILKTKTRQIEIDKKAVLEKYFEISNEIKNEVDYSQVFINPDITENDIIDNLNEDEINPYIKSDF